VNINDDMETEDEMITNGRDLFKKFEQIKEREELSKDSFK